ncbi:hypothetical protein L1987_79032 [Smallanthus sonchifolius]|uniref:Uncharacterized protein n=1 Tax=Smallanthus sonchifolius TaxID=185202 RepID=A0ACB8ZEK7_9ASTR|nr:hypothetical protein L1987_79032 [Smallanthus sonchifolius]
MIVQIESHQMIPKRYSRAYISLVSNMISCSRKYEVGCHSAARFRATCHGISGAVGKVGAIIGTVGYIWASRDPPHGLGVSNTFAAMGGVCVLGFFATYLFTRETMGRSLEENENVDEFTGVWFLRFWPNKFWATRIETNTGK